MLKYAPVTIVNQYLIRHGTRNIVYCLCASFPKIQPKCNSCSSFYLHNIITFSSASKGSKESKPIIDDKYLQSMIAMR